MALVPVAAIEENFVSDNEIQNNFSVSFGADNATDTFQMPAGIERKFTDFTKSAARKQDDNSDFDAIKISRSTMAVVWQNVVLSLGIKIAIMVLGTLGVTGMWLAVFGDVGVTFFAVLNAMRILRK